MAQFDALTTELGVLAQALADEPRVPPPATNVEVPPLQLPPAPNGAVVWPARWMDGGKVHGSHTGLTREELEASEERTLRILAASKKQPALTGPLTDEMLAAATPPPFKPRAGRVSVFSASAARKEQRPDAGGADVGGRPTLVFPPRHPSQPRRSTLDDSDLQPGPTSSRPSGVAAQVRTYQEPRSELPQPQQSSFSSTIDRAPIHSSSAGSVRIFQEQRYHDQVQRREEEQPPPTQQQQQQQQFQSSFYPQQSSYQQQQPSYQQQQPSYQQQSSSYQQQSSSYQQQYSSYQQQSSSERLSYQQQSSSERPSYQQEEQRLWQQERETERQQEERARPASSYRSDYRREDEDHGGYRQQRPFDHLRGGYRDHEDRGYPDDEERWRRAAKERERYFDDTRHHASSSESERYESERFSDDPSPAYGAGSPYGHRPPGQDLDRYGYSRATSEGQRKRELPPWQQRESAPARQPSPPPQRAPPPTSSQKIAEGEAVELTGIMSKPHLNGEIAIVLWRQGDRWKVELNDGSQLALKETNLALLSSDPSDEPFEPPPAQPQQMQQQPRQQQARRDPWASDEDDDGAGVMASSRQPLRTQSPPPALPPKKAPMSLEIPAFNPKKEPMPPKPPEPLKAKPPPPPPPPKPPEPKKEEISYDIDNQDDDDDFDPTEFMDFDM